MLRLLLLALIVGTLPGCALLRTPPSAPVTPSAQLEAAWTQRVERLTPVTRFVVQGRVASSAIGFKADLRWRQWPDQRFEMRVAGPFGAGAAELSGTPARVQVRTGEDAPTISTDPEAWLQRALGVRLPVRGLRWWALGLPDPEHPYQLWLDEHGRAARIVQLEWELEYPDYRAAGALDLPRRIDARNGDTRVIVLADRWEDLAPLPVAVEAPPSN